MQKKIKTQLIEIAEKIVSENKVALYDIEINTPKKGIIITFFITKVGGVSLSDCTKVNRELSLILEEKDLFRDKYFIEVSSPGIERSLKLKKHYKSAINEHINIKFADITNEIITEKGVLNEVLPNHIKITNYKNEEITIPFKNIKKSKTIFKK